MARYRDDKGKKKSAGVYDTKEEAERAAEYAANGRVMTGEHYHPGMTLHEYFYGVWMKSEAVHAKTKEGYESLFRLYVSPPLGTKDIAHISRTDVRRVIRQLEKKTNPGRAAKTKAVIGSVYKYLIEEEEDVVEDSPSRGIKVDVPDPEPFRLMTLDEFNAIVDQLPNEETKFFARFLIASGMRYGEIIEIRVKDFVQGDCPEIHLRRRASHMLKKNNDGRRILVTPATKSGHHRVIPLSPRLADLLIEHIDKHSLNEENLIFGRSTVLPEVLPPLNVSVGDTFEIGQKTFRHGTTYAYGDGACRCDRCRAAITEYRRKYKKARREAPEGIPETEHLLHETWTPVWRKAVRAAGLRWAARTHDLRHANCTMLVGEVGIVEAMERLGHRQISTTQRYAHRVREEQEKAAKAADRFL